MSTTHGPLHRAFAQPAGVLGTIGGIVMAIENRSANRRVVDSLDLRPGERALEIGCGPGVAARAAARHVAPAGRVIAVDPSETMVRLATTLSRRSRSGVEWNLGAAEHLPVDDASIDVAFAINSWHHWDDHAAALRELDRVLAPDGRLIVVERTEQGHHVGAHGIDQRAITALAADLESVIGPAAVEQLNAGREVLALITAHRHTNRRTPT